MIARLTLSSFGKFKDRSFDLAPVTVFHGPNEAGKSTIFDALAKSLCVFRGPQLFLERYGKEAEAVAEFDGAELKFDSTEYFGFYAVKSESISIPFEGDARWMDRVKNSLFSGGVNPQVLAGELEKALNATSRKKAEKERIAALAAATERVAALKADLEAAETSKERARALKLRLDGAAAKVAALVKERGELSLAREEREAGERFRACLAVLKDREKLSSLRASRSVPDESKACRELKKAAEECAARREADSAGQALARQALADALARRQAAEAEAAARERESRIAASLCRGLEEASILRETRQRKPQAASFAALIVGCAAGLAAGLALLASGAPPWSLAPAFAAGAACGAALFLALRKTVVSVDDSAARKACSDARSEWRRLLPESGELPGQDAAQVLSFLRSVVDLGLRAAERADEARRAGAAAETAHAAAAERSEASARAAEASRSAYSLWLQARGAASYEEYLGAVSESALGSARIEELDGSLRERAAAAGAEDLDDLAARAKDELERLRKAFPALEDSGPRGGSAQSARLKQVDAELDRAKEEEKALLAEYSTDRALAERDAAAILEDLADAERGARSFKAAVERDKVQRDAETAAREVFLGMSQSGSLAFSGLSGSVSRYYGGLGSGSRELSLASLDLNAAMVPDASGKARPPRHLSLGTRDIFVLACRLALAEGQRPRDGVLALDEPFKNLDPARIRAALGILKEFRERNGYQVILFTKDPAASRDCLAVFPRQALAIYDLES